MEPWAKVSAGHIARLGELTKREIQILLALFRYRNGSTNRCDPGRKAIGDAAGLPKSHVSLAIAGLETKGWIIERPDRSFHLFDAAEIPPAEPVEKPCGNVEKSVDKVEKVTKSVTNKVTKSVTESYQIGNEKLPNRQLHIKEEQNLNRSIEQKRRRNAGGASAKKPINPLKFAKPCRIPEPFDLSDEMLDWIEREVPGLAVADATTGFLEYWTNNRTKAALKTNWRLTWEKGMRNALKWQKRDAAGNAGPGVEPINPDCKECDGTGRVTVNDFPEPCYICQPDASNRYRRTRGK